MPARFELGRLMITAVARQSLHPTDVFWAVRRHAHADWGDLSAVDKDINDLALIEGHRLFSIYTDRNDQRFFVITEADRSSTTILLPEDY